MRRSTLPARLITVLIALVLTPIGLILLSVGGQTVSRVFFEFGYRQDLSPVIGPLLMQAAGILLLVLVVLTGIWSSAGLIAVGAFAVVAFLLTAIPVVLSWLFRFVPSPWIDGAVYGIPLSVLTVLGAMGFALARTRRDPRPPGAGRAVLGIVLAPLLLAAGAFLLAWGIAEGALLALQRFQFDPQPLAVLATLGGALLLFAGVAVSRWSPWALVLPGAVALIVSLALVAAPNAVFPLLTQLPRGVNMVAPTQLLYGAGTALGALTLVHTAVLLRVRAVARRQPPAATPTPAPYPPAPYPPAPYPPAPYPPAPQPPAPHGS